MTELSHTPQVNQHDPAPQTVAIRQALNIAWAAARGQVEKVANDEYVRMVDLADEQFRKIRADLKRYAEAVRVMDTNYREARTIIDQQQESADIDQHTIGALLIERDRLRLALTYINGTAFAGEASPNALDFQRIVNASHEALTADQETTR